VKEGEKGIKGEREKKEMTSHFSFFLLPKGVVAPYVKQIQKIRQLMRRKGLTAVKVGSPEEFQGNEKKVNVSTNFFFLFISLSIFTFSPFPPFLPLF
jgi:hypothetical protein